MKYLVWAGYLVCLVFIVSGAFNYGESRFFLALPFMAGACVLAWKYSSKRILFYITVAFCLVAIAFNLTLERNPLIFPIIDDGNVEVLVDGNHLTFVADGSSGFFDASFCANPNNREYCEEVTSSNTFIEKGSVFKVKEVQLTSREFARVINIVTEEGYSFSHELISHNEIRVDKEITNPTFEKAGVLMSWPLVPLTAIAQIFGAF